MTYINIFTHHKLNMPKCGVQRMSFSSLFRVILTCVFLTYTEKGVMTRKREKIMSLTRMTGSSVSSAGSAETTGVRRMVRTRKMMLDK